MIEVEEPCAAPSPNGSVLLRTRNSQKKNAMTWSLGRYLAHPLLFSEQKYAKSKTALPIANPAKLGDIVGLVVPANEKDIASALDAAKPWAADADTRAAALNAAADAYEANAGEIFAILTREAGKGLPDAVAELREAVDFLRYYAAQAREGAAPRGVWTCISPWNFPLAIFTGQIAAALAAGNAVLAKPAEQTPIIAMRAVQWLHAAGVPKSALQLIPGGGDVGRLGHGLGMQLTEWPSLIPSDDTILLPGMVLTLEPGIETSGGMLVHEENIVITETGCRFLSPRASTRMVQI